MGTVLGHELHNSKEVTKLDIPEWGTKFSIPLYNVQKRHRDQMPIGATLSMILEADKLKTDKDGNPKDPNKPYNYFWSIVDIGGTNGTSPESSPEPSKPSKPQVPSIQATRDRDIQRQVALKVAVQLYQNEIAGTAISSLAREQAIREDVLMTANRFLDWLTEDSQW